LWKFENKLKSIDLKDGYVINCVISDIPIMNTLQSKDVNIKIFMSSVKTKKAPKGAFLKIVIVVY